jgi:hypothetical protein
MQGKTMKYTSERMKKTYTINKEAKLNKLECDFLECKRRGGYVCSKPV